MRNCLAMGLAVMLLAGFSASLAVAAEEDLDTMVKALKERIKEQDRRLAELENRQNSGYVSQMQKEEIRKVVEEMLAAAKSESALPPWMKNLKFYGDLRLRYQMDHTNYDNEGTAGAQKVRNRTRFRLRFGFVKTWMEDQLEVGFRLASGEQRGTTGYSDSTSANQTFTQAFDKKPIWIDLAYAKYQPKAAKGLKLIGGKMENPFRSTDMIWDNNVNPEGFYGEYEFQNMGKFKPFVGLGHFWVREVAETVGHDTTFMGYNAGFNWEIAKDVKWLFAATYYDYERYDDALTAGTVQARGNDTTGWSPEFKVINLTNKVEWKAFGLPMGAYLDYANNLADTDTTHGYKNQDNAYAVGLSVGKAKKKGEWEVGYKYAYIEANSVPGNWAEATFGFGNRKGHKVYGKYALTDFLTGELTIFSTEPVRSTTGEDGLMVVQADLIWKF